MARVNTTKTNAPGTRSTAGVEVTETAADPVNHHQHRLSPRDLIQARNSGGVSRDVTITSVADRNGRTGTITQAVPAGKTWIFGPFENDGWRQTDGMLYYTAAHADILFSVITLP